MHTIGEWRRKVYRTNTDQDGYTPEWRQLRRNVLLRDSYRCLRCDKRFRSTLLTIHHLTPRSEGGPDIFENLVTLCNPCHDIVEIAGLRTRADIMGDLALPLEVTYEPKQEVIDDDPYHRPEWHRWVYGSKRRNGRR